MTTTRAPIETKTQAAGLAGVVSGALIWVLQNYVFKGSIDPGLVSLIYAAVPGVLAFAAAYVAPHTPRAPAAPAPGVPPTGTVTLTEPPRLVTGTAATYSPVNGPGEGAPPPGRASASLPPSVSTTQMPPLPPATGNQI